MYVLLLCYETRLTDNKSSLEIETLNLPRVENMTSSLFVQDMMPD